VHDAAAAADHDPDAHTVCTPPVQYDPAVHGTHAVWPVFGWCWPSAHTVRAPPVQYDPAGQIVHAAAPAAE